MNFRHLFPRTPHAEPLQAAINTSFRMLGLLTLAMGLTCGAASVCRSLGWPDASALLTRDAQDMLVAVVIALVVLLLLERSTKQPKRRDF